MCNAKLNKPDLASKHLAKAKAIVSNNRRILEAGLNLDLSTRASQALDWQILLKEAQSVVDQSLASVPQT